MVQTSGQFQFHSIPFGQFHIKFMNSIFNLLQLLIGVGTPSRIVVEEIFLN